jgi:phage antirepressor YoqD-like protein
MAELVASGDKRMTVQEVAEALGIPEQTIRNNIRSLFPELMQNGIATYLNEVQVTTLKLEIERHHNLSSTGQVARVSTRLERQLYIAKALQFASVEIQQLQEELAVVEGKLAIAEPKAETLDKITATNNDISIRELAAILAISHLGQNKLFQKLRDDGYIDGFNRPYRQYIEGGLMYEKEYYVPQLDATKLQLRITQKGVAHFAKKYGRASA